tara:strand:+ start:94 stop:924 length:831 start_codon:yes stop_codon:yes gene_type:complete
MATKQELFGGDFLKVRSNIPMLKEGESAASFRKRVKMWSNRTGLTYPGVRANKSGGFSPIGIGMQRDEIRVLSGVGDFEGATDTGQDFSKAYTSELNQIVQQRNKLVQNRKATNKKISKIPTKGISDIRGDLKIKQDEERSKTVPLDELDQYSDVQDTSGYAETEALLTPMYDAQNDPFKGMRTGEEETTPTMADFATYDNDTSSNKAQTNNTSSRSNLNIGPRAVGPAGISDRNVPKGYIRTEGKLQSVNSVKGQRAKLRLDRLRKLQARIKAGK